MDLENSYSLILDAIKSYIKELSTTKKGKYSKRKFTKNKNKIFYATSLAVDIEMERNKDKINESIKKHFDQFADARDITCGEYYEFEIGKKVYQNEKDSLRCSHIKFG